MNDETYGMVFDTFPDLAKIALYKLVGHAIEEASVFNELNDKQKWVFVDFIARALDKDNNSDYIRRFALVSK